MIAYVNSVEPITSDMLQGFFDGWPNPPSRETHLRLLQRSDAVVIAVDQFTGKAVGFITAITDGVLSAYIPLVEVLPAYRQQGIGHELVHRMLEQLSDYYMIDLSCDSSLKKFYEKHQMTPAVAMVKRNYHRQSGS